jgi:uncharacterized protein (TIGR02453 family)
VATSYFTPELFRFLTELRAHNERDWFLANKERYEAHVRAPFLRFIGDLGPRLKRISPHFVADPKPVGGSLMRINRDIRFSRDKSPYKTGMGAHFWHDRGEEGAMPAFYLRLEPGKSVIGGGIWHPDPKALGRIRDAIASRSKDWRRVTQGGGLGKGCELMGETLKRPPKGYAPDHPCINDIKRKDFGLGADLENGEVTGPRFMDDVVERYRRTAPLLKFLSESLGLPF